MYKIMLVDDEVAITMQLEQRLVSMGYEVAGSACSGEESVDMARELRPDLVQMDIDMPGKLDGIEAAETIKAELDIPIVFLTAYADDSFVSRARNVQPFGYIVKPFHEEEIKATIECALFKKKLERKLQASEEQLRAIVETVPSLLQICDVKGEVIYVSPNCEKITGYTQEELKCSIIQWVHEDDMQGVKEAIGRGLRESKPAKELEYKGMKKNGELWYALSSWEPLRDKEGKYQGIVLQTVDISERRRSEEEIRKYSEELELKIAERTKELVKERDYVRHLIENSPNFHVTLSKDGKIIDVNGTFENIVGKCRDDIIGDFIYRYLAEEKEIRELLTEVFEKGYVKDVELAVNIPGKEAMICIVFATLFTTLEGEAGVYITGRDITEQKKKEEELRAKELEIIHAGRLSNLGEMAAGISHEINQPLTIISTIAEGVLRDIEKNRFDIDLLPGEAQEIMKNIERIDSIISHMRLFTRQQVRWEYVEPEQLVRNAFIMLKQQFREHDILLSQKIEQNLPALKVEPNQLEQVFINISINARQALDKRGEEAKKDGKVFQKQLICSISRENEYVLFEFSDNAHGVPDEIKTRIFEPFFTTKEPGEGTGLGLSIAYRIVTYVLRGKIWVEDNEMGGATFKMALPIVPIEDTDTCDTSCKEKK
jgi:histidine kinase